MDIYGIVCFFCSWCVSTVYSCVQVYVFRETRPIYPKIQDLEFYVLSILSQPSSSSSGMRWCNISSLYDVALP